MAANESGPPPPPAQEEQSRIIEAARESALRYTKSLPDFLCTQTVSRYSNRKLEDTLEISVGYSAKGERYIMRQEGESYDRIRGQAAADFAAIASKIAR